MGLVLKSAPAHLWAMALGGCATFDEVRSAGLIVDGGEHWRDHGYDVDAESRYIARAIQLKGARDAKRARGSVTGSVTQERRGEERNGSEVANQRPIPRDLDLPGGEPVRLRRGAQR